MLKQLWNDDSGVVVSADLILVLTIAVLSMLVGLNELANGIINELADIGDAFGHLDQSFFVSSFASVHAGPGGDISRVSASFFTDRRDEGDNCNCANALSCSNVVLGTENP